MPTPVQIGSRGNDSGEDSNMFQKMTLLGATFIAASLSTHSVFSQEIEADHLAVAKSALIETKATEGFDNILPAASVRLKNRLSANNPDRAAEIDATVDEQALALAPRRGDLESEAAKLFAVTFTKEELEKISEFFGTDTGQKYLASTPVLARELAKSARIWGNGIQRDLEQNATKKLQEAKQ